MRQFRKNSLTTHAKGGTHWTIDRFERTVTLHVRMVVSHGRPHIFNIVEGLLHYICRQWRLNHIEKTVTLHVQTVASCGHPHILDVVEGLSCYMCRQRRLNHIEKTVLLHVQTVEPQTHREDQPSPLYLCIMTESCQSELMHQVGELPVTGSSQGGLF